LFVSYVIHNNFETVYYHIVNRAATGFASWQHYCTASSSGRQPNFAALNRGRHLYSAGGPSRWALAHISSLKYFNRYNRRLSVSDHL